MKVENIEKIIKSNDAFRAMSAKLDDSNEEQITVEGVAIVANWIDSHGSIFTRECLEGSLEEMIIHNTDHVRNFDSLISNQVETSLIDMSLRELGIESEGSVPAFVFKSTFTKEDNERMFREYKRGRVKYHSIEFDWQRRAEEIICVSSTYNASQEYKDNWDKYYPLVANKEVADERGWFYVYERAPIVAISAVVLGSNRLTPTLSARGFNDLKIELQEIVQQVEEQKEEKRSMFSRLG